MKNQLFEFGQYWDTGTFIVFFLIGILIALLAKQGSKAIRNEDIICNIYEGKVKSNKFNITLRINKYYTLIFIILWSIFSLRNSTVGADTPYYVNDFLYASGVNLSTSIDELINSREPLFLLITNLIRSITNSYTVYFMILGIIVAFAYTKFIKTFWTRSDSYILIIGLMVEFHYDLNVMRTALGMSFVLLSLCAIVDNKWTKSFVLGIIGVLFHYTTLVHIPLLIITFIVNKRKQLSKMKISFLLTLSAIIMLSSVPLFSTYFLSSRYHGYVERALEGTGNILGYWYIILSIMLSVVLLIINRETFNKNNVLIMSTLYNALLLIINAQFGAYRLTNLYVPARLSLWDTLPNRFRSPQAKLISKIILCSFLLVYMMFRLSRYSSSPGFSYKFFWN